MAYNPSLPRWEEIIFHEYTTAKWENQCLFCATKKSWECCTMGEMNNYECCTKGIIVKNVDKKAGKVI